MTPARVRPAPAGLVLAFIGVVEATLTNEQIRSFVKDGLVRLDKAFPKRGGGRGQSSLAG